MSGHKLSREYKQRVLVFNLLRAALIALAVYGFWRTLGD